MVLSHKSGFNWDRLLYSALRILQTTRRLLPKIEERTCHKNLQMLRMNLRTLSLNTFVLIKFNQISKLVFTRRTFYFITRTNFTLC